MDNLYGGLLGDGFSRKITGLRNMNNLSREDLAAKLQTHVYTIREWEKGINTPTKTNAEKLYSLFAADLDKLK